MSALRHARGLMLRLFSPVRLALVLLLPCMGACQRPGAGTLSEGYGAYGQGGYGGAATGAWNSAPSGYAQGWGQRMDPQGGASTNGSTYRPPAAPAPQQNWGASPAMMPGGMQMQAQATQGASQRGWGWRGSGNQWRGGQRALRGHQARDKKAPSVAAPNWQSAPYYSQTQGAPSAPAYDSSPPPGYSYGAGSGASGGWGAPGASSWNAGQRVAPGGGAAPMSSGRDYVIQKGDTLSGIARRHQVSLGALLQANGLRMDEIIHPGQPLRIPGR